MSKIVGLVLMAVGAFFLLGAGPLDDGSLGTSGRVFWALFGVVGIGVGIWLLFTQNPVITRLDEKYEANKRKQAQREAEEEAKEALEEQRKRERREALIDGGLKGLVLGKTARPQTAPQPAPADASGAGLAAAAQVDAIANPETAAALQNLQHLLYTRTITDSEFQLAKDRLFLSPPTPGQADASSNIEKLAQLHEAGILSDVEFATAKLKALGLA